MHADWAQSGTLIAAGKKLEYVCIGPPPSDAPTLVLLHEGLGCIKLWRDVPATIAAATGFGVFVYSRAGYGESDPVELPRPTFLPSLQVWLKSRMLAMLFIQVIWPNGWRNTIVTHRMLFWAGTRPGLIQGFDHGTSPRYWTTSAFRFWQSREEMILTVRWRRLMS